jgi:serine/threonine protein kinase
VLKIPHLSIAGDLAAFNRLRREVEIGTRLDHPGIERLLSDPKLPYIVLEYVDGTTLRTHLRDHAPLPVDEALALTARLAETLEYVAGRGILADALSRAVSEAFGRQIASSSMSGHEVRAAVAHDRRDQSGWALQVARLHRTLHADFGMVSLGYATPRAGAGSQQAGIDGGHRSAARWRSRVWRGTYEQLR